MICPSCHEPMVVLEVENIEVDHCIACGGVWLDAGELELMLDTASNKDELMATLSEDIEGKEKTIRCPICSKKLFKVRYGTEKTLLLDKCPRNDGLWFDKGELCDALKMGNFKRGKPIYDVLNDIFGGQCRNGER